MLSVVVIATLPRRHLSSPLSPFITDHQGYDYQLPELGYTPNSSWGAWDLATARYTGDRLQRSFFDNLLTSLGNFFNSRHLSEDSARNAHRRVYHSADGEDAGNRTLGGAAAYQAWLLWDRDHYTLYHQMPSPENMQRLVGLAVAELYRLWDHLNPRSSRANLEEAAQYAAATAKYLYERHYDIPSSNQGGFGHMFRGGRHSGYGADDDSDSGSETRRMRRRSMYGGRHMNGSVGPMGMMPGGTQGMMPMQGGMLPPPGYGMQAPGYGAMGMPGAMAAGMGGGYMSPMMHGPGAGMGMNPMMATAGGAAGGIINPMLMQGGYGNPNNEAQAGPGMHPYHFGAQSGVAYGSQPIDQLGNPTFPGGPGRSWYAYGTPRPY
ncbi:hypothetical protein DB88DRAFT_484648 [Papiliotrema laurentii]|uniref:DUF7721 domain-containing protein n=1 Tax=Papiliotrema laurentii TaxID=5418 RepID=A0AAD9L7U3_PAPLA|nr:hypothetical protein DB88DRAFT_484648 [Papiliotrema laurentii]